MSCGFHAVHVVVLAVDNQAAAAALAVAVDAATANRLSLPVTVRQSTPAVS